MLAEGEKLGESDGPVDRDEFAELHRPLISLSSGIVDSLKILRIDKIFVDFVHLGKVSTCLSSSHSKVFSTVHF